MWLATLDGFFSTVTDTQEPSRMLIRARWEKDINNLFNRYRDKCPSIKPPTSDDARDYRRPLKKRPLTDKQKKLIISRRPLWTCCANWAKILTPRVLHTRASLP